MSEDINPNSTTSESEPASPAETPEAARPRSEILKTRLVKLGKGILSSPRRRSTEKRSEGLTAPLPTEEADSEEDWFLAPLPPIEDTGEPIEEDTPRSLEEPSEIEAYLRAQGVNAATIEQVAGILERSQADLIKEHLAVVGVESENLEEAAHLLKPLHIYLRRLHQLGMPPEKDKAASDILHEGAGQLRLEHLESLVGGELDELRRLMRTPQGELLAQEFRGRFGYDETTISLIAATPRLNRTMLVNEALKRLGLQEALIDRVELLVEMSEVPPEIAEQASAAGISLENLVRARAAFRRADWQETYDYLELAKTDAGARELLKSHGIEIAPPLETMSLKEINEQYPEKWQAERDRRVSQRRREFFRMLERFKDYLPLEEFPLPDDVGIRPEESIPEDFPGAYGLWRRVVTDNLANQLATEDGYKQVLRHIERVGGPVITRRFGHKVMARKLLAAQRAREREMGVDRNHGAFGLGREQYRTNLRAIQELDTTSREVRRALNRFHRGRFTKDGQATARRRLAETIVEHKLKEIALDSGRLDLVPPHQIKIPDDLREPHAEDELSGEGTV